MFSLLPGSRFLSRVGSKSELLPGNVAVATHNLSASRFTARMTSYSPHFLKYINSFGYFTRWINCDLRDRLKHLRLLRSYRGCRSGKAVKDKLRNVRRFNIQTLARCTVSSEHYHSQINQRKLGHGINFSNLHIVKDIPSISLKAKDQLTLRQGLVELKFCLLNAQSVRNKSTDLLDYIVDRKCDLVSLTETWLSSIDDAVRVECLPDGYKISDYQREGRAGGGLALIHRDNIIIKQNQSGEKSSFEFSEWTLNIGSSNILLIILYRPPYSQTHPVTVNSFLAEFSDFLEHVVLNPQSLLICGDFNIHVDDPNSRDAKSFIDLLESFGLEQHVHTPTHAHGHTLDLVITRIADPLVCSVPCSDRYLSDHSAVLCDLSIVKPSLSVKEISYRKLKGIDMDLFKNEILSSDLIINTPRNLDNLVNCYNATLSTILNNHAPVITKTITVRPQVPWFTNEVRNAKRLRRKAECKWRLSRSHQDRTMFNQLKNSATYIMNKARRDFYTNFVLENSDNQHNLFKATKKLLNLRKETPLPPHTDKTALANDIGDFFVKKIDGIREELDKNEANSTLNSPTSSSTPCSSTLAEFVTLTADDVKSLISKAPTKSSLLDPMPTQLVKDCIDVLLPVISTMINTSLQSGYFSTTWKEAIVTPLLKKPGLDLIYNNYRPVSNLSFISKLSEKAVSKQIHSYLSVFNLYPPNQSAYRPNHSTETTLLKIKNDILLNMNRQHVTLLVLLDLSAAFDTVDHRILLRCLQSDFGITGNVLSWFTSYLADREQRISIDGVCSKVFKLAYGVPQGSCLGPLLFTLYVSKLSEIIQSHLPDGSCYADDTQLYLAFKPCNDTEQAKAAKAMELCIEDIRKWMLTVKLKLNDSKTEFLLIGTRQQLAKVNLQHLTIGNAEIGISSVARNLGSWFDSTLSMEVHVSKLCKSSFYYLYNLRRIRKYLSCESAATLVHAFITSRLDYCNSLLYGMPAYLIQKVQRIQNAAARIVSQSSKYDHITPVLYHLHWLPVEYRIRFKILVLTYKSMHGCSPTYIQNLLATKQLSRYNLRSDGNLQLATPSLKTQVTTGDRAFMVASPKLWNSLPLNIRMSENIDIFKHTLKTHLFTLAFKNRILIEP